VASEDTPTIDHAAKIRLSRLPMASVNGTPRLAKPFIVNKA
jgi:hypothetical protein